MRRHWERQHPQAAELIEQKKISLNLKSDVPAPFPIHNNLDKYIESGGRELLDVPDSGNRVYT